MASLPPATEGRPSTRACMTPAAWQASSAVLKVAMSSSPMVFTTLPPQATMARSTRFRQRSIARSASASPSFSYSCVLPATSANNTQQLRVVAAMTLPVSGDLAGYSRGLGLGVFGVHGGVGLVGRRFGLADLDGVAHVGHHGAQRRQRQHDVFRLAGIAHQAEAPDLAGERAETGA